jgi:hypothetical protein
MNIVQFPRPQPQDSIKQIADNAFDLLTEEEIKAAASDPHVQRLAAFGSFLNAIEANDAAAMRRAQKRLRDLGISCTLRGGGPDR